MIPMTLMTRTEALALVQKAQSIVEVSAKYATELSKIKSVRILVLK